MKVSTTQKKENKALWWGAWIASLVSFIIGGAVAWAIAGPVLDPLSGLFAGAIAGAVIGLAQWLALRSLLTTSMGAKWAAATILGISVGVAVGATLVNYRIGGVDLAVMGFVTGVSVGALQAWALKDRVTASWRWLLLSPPLWAASWLVTWGIGVDMAAHWAVFGLSGAILYTFIAGFVLRFLLREPSPTPAPTAIVINARAQKAENVVKAVAVDVSSAN
jgi:hypothetical protein